MNHAEGAPRRSGIGPGQALRILSPYVKRKILEQVRSVALVVLYLLFFQTAVLRIPLAEASDMALGLAVLIVGLAFFLEGLVLGLMPLGEAIGLKLPERAHTSVILAFSFILGVGATFAEPAIGILKSAGAGVKPWEAPLLFVMLNTYPHQLIYAVGAGVGVAVLFGMLRYLHGWSLKPFIYVLLAALLTLTGWAHVDPKLQAICGLAWDCGAVTTGPVTVPLILALGIGVCRVVGLDGDETSGFGVVTLASLFPVLSVLMLGAAVSPGLPGPMTRDSFFKAETRGAVLRMFGSEDALMGYALRHGSEAEQMALFDGDRSKMLGFLRALRSDEARRRAVFGPEPEAMERWAARRGTHEQRLALLGTAPAPGPGDLFGKPPPAAFPEGLGGMARRNALVAVQAVIPLALFLFLVLAGLLRERLPRTDEVVLGIGLALVGMVLFNMGMEMGLSKLGGQVGERLPSAFRAVALPEHKRIIEPFHDALVQTAVDERGGTHRFFFFKQGERIEALPFDERGFDREARRYAHIPRKGPLFGGENAVGGVLVILLFALVMGYGATLAEPALNALGLAVEEITVGLFRKTVLIHTVALGVGAGIALGVLKIVWGIPLWWLLAPFYIVLLFLTMASTEEFVNIAWDSAGVTTGPVTVPLVLAMGLGLGNQVEVVEGFGILAMASVCPILTVLIIGLRVSRAERAAFRDGSVEGEEEGARPS